MLASSVRTTYPTHATLYGTRGRLHINAPIYRPDGLKWVKTKDPDAGLVGGKLSQDKAKSFLGLSGFIPNFGRAYGQWQKAKTPKPSLAAYRAMAINTKRLKPGSAYKQAY